MAVAWASATPASGACAPAPCATCAPAMSRRPPDRWSARVSPRPPARSRSTSNTRIHLMNAPLEHLTPEDLDDIGRELDAIRDELMADLGERDAAYIRKVVKVQRGLEGAGRAALLVSLFPPAWLAGTTALAVAKVLENMEIGHNVMHGQWDWMRDPEIHSTTWEWDNISSAEGWKRSHNYEHHTYTNIVGKDRDLGYTLLRRAPAQPWKPFHLAQPLYNIVLAVAFEWGVELEEARKGRKPWRRVASDVGRLARKATRQ